LLVAGASSLERPQVKRRASAKLPITMLFSFGRIGRAGRSEERV
jgi:hypothetical protein